MAVYDYLEINTIIMTADEFLNSKFSILNL